jgi:hypothetical protein
MLVGSTQARVNEGEKIGAFFRLGDANSLPIVAQAGIGEQACFVLVKM